MTKKSTQVDNLCSVTNTINWCSIGDGNQQLILYLKNKINMLNNWFHIPQPNPTAKVRLFCLPHAGGTAGLFRPWSKLLLNSIELVLVCLPNREQRCNDVMPDTFTELIHQLSNAIISANLLDKPWAIFGHSMGANLGHEVILKLKEAEQPTPVHLFISACEAPQFKIPSQIRNYSDQDLCNELFKLGGTSKELFEVVEIRELILPMIRHDYALIEKHQATKCAIDCPITAFIGLQDQELMAREVKGWQTWTHNHFSLEKFNGGHFYLSEQPSKVIETIHKYLYPHI
ncbi:thioesterase II family protein [Aliivibrio fischeri]|uniref:Thioesterase n=1 Tax=Aliivibrio fischeri TaxID=668 RepID=A0A510UM46_ALIFS|nr:thioesterase domain-containing protein [Aliivibrio fischeri]MUK51030.1 thioesterase [Aliivibrio fischeri]GEK15639.1 thioesterase [Aliivibrio fischeri]